MKDLKEIKEDTRGEKEEGKEESSNSHRDFIVISSSDNGSRIESSSDSMSISYLEEVSSQDGSSIVVT